MKRKTRYPLIISIILLVILFRYLVAPRFYEFIKQEVAVKYATDSDIQGASENRQSALEKLQVAHKLDPDNLEISRKLAEALKKESPENAIKQYQAILEHPKAQIEDKVALIRSAIEIGDFSKAESILSSLEQNELGDYRLEYHFFRAKVYDTLGKIEQAIRQLRMIIVEEESPIHNSARFLFIRAAIKSSQPLLIKEAKELLHSMSLKDGEEGIEAIRFYFGIQGFSEQDALDVFVKTLKHPLATNKDKLDAASLYQKTVPARTSLIIDSIKSELDFAEADPKDMYDFCFWLARIHEWQALVEHLSLSNSLLSAKLYTLRLDALGNLGKWDQIIEATSLESAPIPDHFRLAFLARAYRQNGNVKTSLDQMDLILSKINDDRDALFKTCEYLERINETESLLYLLDKAVQTIPALEAYACSKRIRHKLGTATLDELCKWYGVLHTSSTNVFEFRTRKTYFDLLADKNLGESILNAKSLYASDPAQLEHRVLMALALVKSGKGKEALDIFDTTPIGVWTQSTVGWKMIYAHLMKQNGLAERAESFLRTVPTAKLSRAEREGLENL